MCRFVHARDVSDLGEVMDLVCYIVPHFTRRYDFDRSPCKFRPFGSSAELSMRFLQHSFGTTWWKSPDGQQKPGLVVRTP